MMIPSFAKKVKYTVSESVIVRIADWSVKTGRPDLCLVAYSMALGANILSESFKIPPRHQNAILEEFPSAFSEGVEIEFSVIIEGGE